MTLRTQIKQAIKAVSRRLNIEIRRIPSGDYESETSKCRSRLVGYCVGNGLDLGPGGDPIQASAVRVDLATPYSRAGHLPVQLGGSADNLYWFSNECLDYIFSSHLLEDFIDTELVLREWLRTLRRGGRLVLFCPDEQVYREHCKRTGQPYNTHHVHEDFSMMKVKSILDKINNTKIIHEQSIVDVYSWELVAEKV